MKGGDRGDSETGQTYNRAFFLGPGLPLGLGVVSTPWPSPLLLPGLGPGTAIFFEASESPEGVVAPGAAAAAAGVDAPSETLSPDAGTPTAEVLSAAGAAVAPGAEVDAGEEESGEAEAGFVLDSA